MHNRDDRGFSLAELMVVCAMIGIVAAMAVPGILATLRLMKLNAAARDVHSELQSARLRAVSGDRPMRIRFDCPAAGQFRAVELLGTPALPDPADSTADRCNPITYPYPARDANRLTRPNLDGPPRFLPAGMAFTASQTIEFWPDGTAHVNSSGANPWPAIVNPVSVTIADGSRTKSITVNGVGKVQSQ